MPKQPQPTPDYCAKFHRAKARAVASLQAWLKEQDARKAAEAAIVVTLEAQALELEQANARTRGHIEVMAEALEAHKTHDNAAPVR